MGYAYVVRKHYKGNLVPVTAKKKKTKVIIFFSGLK